MYSARLRQDQDLCGRISLATYRRPAGIASYGNGEVAEWSNVPDSKSGVRVTVPWVRIPPSPPGLLNSLDYFWNFSTASGSTYGPMEIRRNFSRPLRAASLLGSASEISCRDTAGRVAPIVLPLIATEANKNGLVLAGDTAGGTQKILALMKKAVWEFRRTRLRC